MKLFSLILFLIVFKTLYTQSNEIGLSLFKVEKSSITINNNYEPKFITSVHYIKSFKKIHWISSIEYGENEIDDNCNSCSDHFYGNGLFKEFTVLSGLGIGWNKPLKNGVLGLFSRIKVSGGTYHYLGDFLGGISGIGFYTDKKYYAIGGQLEVGFQYINKSNFLFRVNFSTQFSQAWSKNNLVVSKLLIKEGLSMFNLPKLSIGYQF